ncbi:MAG: DUF11 domain-containing protein [Nitrospirae bacterium]|nr:DUF11 domain-containing protein [Nitrospirota bacterium]
MNLPTPNTADLSITKSDSPDPAITGGLLTYTLTVTNNGPNDTTGVTVTDTLPAGVTLVSVTPSQGSMCTGTTTITCGLGSILNGGMATVIIVVTPTSSGTITNSASVTGVLTDPNMANNSATQNTNVGDLSRLINISTRGPVQTGDNVMIGGFIIGGSLAKAIIVRGFDPSMIANRVSGTMANPYLELWADHDNNPSTPQVLIAQNDNSINDVEIGCIGRKTFLFGTVQNGFPVLF